MQHIDVQVFETNQTSREEFYLHQCMHNRLVAFTVLQEFCVSFYFTLIMLLTVVTFYGIQYMRDIYYDILF